MGTQAPYVSLHSDVCTCEFRHVRTQQQVLVGKQSTVDAQDTDTIGSDCETHGVSILSMSHLHVSFSRQIDGSLTQFGPYGG